jgi:hypothetical protein
MPPEQEAGAIIIALKAQIDNLEKGFAKAKQTLKGFGQDVQGAAVFVEKGGPGWARRSALWTGRACS